MGITAKKQEIALSVSLETTFQIKTNTKSTIKVAIINSISYQVL